LLEDFATTEATVRVFRLSRGAGGVNRHVHHRSTQIYVALEGSALIESDGETTVLAPYRATVIAPGSTHSAQPAQQTAILMNISIPPLQADDQVPVVTTDW
jgi:mannose-6-phosphate isomerase-like protein (cupin superfamily)